MAGAAGTRSAWFSRLKRLFGLDRIAGLVVLALLLVVYVLDPLPVQILRVKLFDLYQVLKPRAVIIEPVTIVDIDEDSLAEYGQWPWPRVLLAELVEKIMALGAVQVAFDVVFPEADRMNPANVASILQGLDDETRRIMLRLPSNDEIFASKLSAYPVVLGRHGFSTTREDDGIVALKRTVHAKRTLNAPDPLSVVVTAPGLIRNIPILESVGKGHGFITIFPEQDGIVRRVPTVIGYEGELYPALSMEMLRVLTGRPAVIAEFNDAGMTALRIDRRLPTIPTDRNGRAWPYFSLPNHGKYVSVKSVLEGTADPNRFAGKLVILGTSAFGLHDIRSIPTASLVPGVEVHAQVIESALTESFLRRPGIMLGIEAAIVLAGGVLLIWLVPWIGAKWSALLFIAIAGGAAGTAWYLFTGYLLLFDVGYLTIALLLLYTLLTFSGYASEEASRRRVRQAFGFYLAPAMVEKLAEDPGQLKLGGETRTMSILFCDVRGFTTISETFKGHPEGLTSLINKLLTPLTAVILDRRGTVDKYMGDCIMAFWNAPLDDPDHARHACLAALEMQAVMGPLNERLGAEALAEGRDFQPLAVGIGVNTGDVVVGNMGSDQRFDYSVLGDDVNLASRLEGQSKSYRVGIVVGENTRARVPDLAFLELDLIRVKGKRTVARIFTLVGDATTRTGNTFPMLDAAHDRFLAAYRAQRWDDARMGLGECRKLVDGFGIASLYDVYEARISEYEQTPPGAAWDGVYEATAK